MMNKLLCSKCGEWKEIPEFSGDARNPLRGGKSSWCRNCKIKQVAEAVRGVVLSPYEARNQYLEVSGSPGVWARGSYTRHYRTA